MAEQRSYGRSNVTVAAGEPAGSLRPSRLYQMRGLCDLEVESRDAKRCSECGQSDGSARLPVAALSRIGIIAKRWPAATALPSRCRCIGSTACR